MYRSALVALKPEGSNEELLHYAVELARRYSLRLSGIAILDRDLVSPPEAVPLGGMAFKVELDEARIARAKAQIAAVTALFSDHCSAAGVAFDASCGTDHLCPEIARSVQRHDLLLLGHDAEHRAGGSRRDASPLSEILRKCPCPAIVVPQRPAAEAESVVVAYDGSRQAVRALKSFIASGFEVQSPIYVVACDEDLDEARQVASLALDLLNSHGYSAHAAVESIPPGQTKAGLIDLACRKHRARLLVMGAYGKPTIREFLFGSVTKKLLAEAQLPILLDH